MVRGGGLGRKPVVINGPYTRNIRGFAIGDIHPIVIGGISPVTGYGLAMTKRLTTLALGRALA